MISPTLFLDAHGQHDPAKYVRWHKKRLRTIRKLHKEGFRELYHYFGWDSVRGMSVFMEFGLLETRMPLSVYDMYTMSPTTHAAGWLHYDVTYDILFVAPRKGKVLKAQMAEHLANSQRGWFDRYHNDYMTAAQKPMVQSPGYGWPVMRHAIDAGERLGGLGVLRLDSWMEQHDLSDMHLELAGVQVPHPTNLYYDQLLSIPTRFGSRFIAMVPAPPDLVIKPGQANKLLRRVGRYGT